MFLKEVNYLSQNLFVAMCWQLFITLITPKQKKKQTGIQGYLHAHPSSSKPPKQPYTNYLSSQFQFFPLKK